ncbi:MAG: NAD(P)H-hydrate dehydratase, partial [Chloroflexi bacterium]|nr:NAD(P)H-hydrate dehydratase [Chloroflexota bacterium]
APAESKKANSIFETTDAQIVLDADALNWLAKQDQWWDQVPAHRLVLTPHPGEAHRLSGIEIDEIVADPTATAHNLASKWHQTVVIKSGNSAVSNADAEIVADLAPVSLATAGAGDCFAGAIGAYLAQGASPIDAVTLAMGIGTRAAETLEDEWGVGGVLATDLPDAMARVAAKLSRD